MTRSPSKRGQSPSAQTNMGEVESHPDEATRPNLVPPHAVLPKIVRFADLSRCGDELWIEHDGMLYRLRKTRQGKLILTK